MTPNPRSSMILVSMTCFLQVIKNLIIIKTVASKHLQHNHNNLSTTKEPLAMQVSSNGVIQFYLTNNKTTTSTSTTTYKLQLTIEEKLIKHFNIQLSCQIV